MYIINKNLMNVGRLYIYFKIGIDRVILLNTIDIMN